MPAARSRRRPQLFSSLEGYQLDWLLRDLLAGVSVWTVLVPEAFAYATIAGVPPVVGLYAAPPALLLYGVFGSSKQLVTGPMAATAALSASAVATVAASGSAHFVAGTAALAITIGALALAAGLLRLGFVASFISEPVLKGFIIGLAVTIIVGQIPKLLGVTKAKGDFFQQVWGLLSELGATKLATFAIGLASLALVLLLQRLAPLVPASLVVVFLGIVAVRLLDLSQHGVAIVGHINGGLPSFGLPGGISWGDYGTLAGSAVGIMLVGFVEGLGAAKTYAAREHYDIDANRELIGLGAANVASGLFAGMLVNGSLSKTAVNSSAGARSQVSGLIVASLTIVTLLFLTGLFEDLPEATLAAVVIAALVDLVDFRPLVRLYGLYTSELGRVYGFAARADFIACVAALVGVLALEILPGLFIGIAVSVLLLVYRSSRPNVAVLGLAPGDAYWVDVTRHPEASRVPGILVVRPESGLYYTNADAVKGEILRQVGTSTQACILDAQSVPAIDITGADMLAQLKGELGSRGIAFVVARDIGQVADMLVSAAHGDEQPELYPTVAAALEAVRRVSPSGDQL